MTRFRRFAYILWFAAALLVGQQAAALHALGHATEQLSQKHDGKRAPATCDQCFACAELSGAVGASAPQVPAITAGASHRFPSCDGGASTPSRLAFRSRAPPSLL
jgi:hypothetical protein